jgi:hypothetical protein
MQLERAQSPPVRLPPPPPPPSITLPGSCKFFSFSCLLRRSRSSSLFLSLSLLSSHSAYSCRRRRCFVLLCLTLMGRAPRLLKAHLHKHEFKVVTFIKSADIKTISRRRSSGTFSYSGNAPSAPYELIIIVFFGGKVEAL